MQTKNKNLIFIFVGIFLYIIDRLIKIGFMKLPDRFGSFLEFLPFRTELYTNEGISFGMKLPHFIIIIFSIIIIGIVVWYIVDAYKRNNFSHVFGWGMIIIGGLSNFYDRVVYGYVVDWWVMPWNAVINFADFYITIGIFFLLVDLRRK